MTIFGILFAILALTLIARRKSLLTLIAASVPFFDSVVIQVGGIAVTPYYMCLIFVIPVLLKELMEERNGLVEPKFGYKINIILLYVAVLLSSVLALIFFQGIPVVNPKRPGSNEYGAIIDSLTFNDSNIAQLVYFTLNIVFLFYMSRRSTVQIKQALRIAILVGLSVAIGIWVSEQVGLYQIHELFDNSVRNFYAIQGEELRFRGQFSEPSHLALFCLAALGYSLGKSVETISEHKRPVETAFCWTSTVLLLAYSSTSTATVALFVIVILFMVYLLLSSRRFSRWLSTIFPAMLVVGACVVLPVSRFYADIVGGKVSTYSYRIRSEQDAHAWQVLSDTHLMGAGLGSNATSSFFTYLLSNIGVLGTLLFLVFVLRILFSILKHPDMAASSFALIGVLIASFISVGLFGNPLLWFSIAVCYGLATNHEMDPESISEDVDRGQLRLSQEK